MHSTNDEGTDQTRKLSADDHKRIADKREMMLDNERRLLRETKRQKLESNTLGIIDALKQRLATVRKTLKRRVSIAERTGLVLEEAFLNQSLQLEEKGRYR